MAIPKLEDCTIGVFAWYEHGLAFTDGEYADLHAQLSGKSSESPDEYYDGSYAYGGNTYNVRVRKDGYILTWLPNTTEPAYDFDYSGNPPLSQRAIQAIMNAAGVSGFDFAKCYYYVITYPSAITVRWFGATCDAYHSHVGPYSVSDERTFYYTPSTTPMYFALKSYTLAKYVSDEGVSDATQLPFLIGSENTVWQKGWTTHHFAQNVNWYAQIKVNDTLIRSSSLSNSSTPGYARVHSVFVALL